MLTPLDPEPHLDEAVAAVQAAAEGTEWEAAFPHPEVVAEMRQQIGIHFATAQHIERSCGRLTVIRRTRPQWRSARNTR